MKKLVFLFVPVLLFSCKQTCTDGVQNQNETAVDCGGDCQICQTCFDGELNNGEALIDCGGDYCNPCGIQYDSVGTYGLNVLYGGDSLNLTNDTYSFQAFVPDGSILKIKLYAVVGGWFYTMPQNWSVGPYTSTQEFTVTNPGNAECGLDLSQSAVNSEFVIQYFENGQTVTKQKVITLN